MVDQPAASAGGTAPSAASQPHIDPIPRITIQAFCESSEVAGVIQSALGDRRMGKTHAKQHMGGAAAAAEAYRSAATPNVIVIEAPAERDKLRMEVFSSCSARCSKTCRTLASEHAGFNN